MKFIECFLKFITQLIQSYIASNYDLEQIVYVNLSGCLNLTAQGLRLFIEKSQNLQGENLFYCDNIVNGPFEESANGCENVDCTKKFCCRTLRF